MILWFFLFFPEYVIREKRSPILKKFFKTESVNNNNQYVYNYHQYNPAHPHQYYPHHQNRNQNSYDSYVPSIQTNSHAQAISGSISSGDMQIKFASSGASASSGSNQDQKRRVH